MHLDIRQLAQERGDIHQLIQLNCRFWRVGEMAEILVIGAGDMGQLAHLFGGQRAIGYRDAQHIGMELR